MELIRFIIGAILIICGIVVSYIATFGVLRFDFILNRMHAAALTDTLGILFVMAGLIVINGFTFHSLKLALIIIFFWLVSPVSSHLISRLVVTINDKLDKHCDVNCDINSLKEEDNGID